MKNTTVNTKDLELTVPVPDSIEEYDRLAGAEGSALSKAIKSDIYNYYNLDFGIELCKELEKELETPRKTKQGDNGKDVYTETETQYIARLKEDNTLSEAKYKTIGKKVAKRVKFNNAPRQRAAAPPKATTAMAQDLIDAVSSGDANEAEVKASFERQIEEVTSFDESFGDFCLETVTKAIVTFDAQETAKKKSKFLS